MHGYFVAHSDSGTERPWFRTCYNKHAYERLVSQYQKRSNTTIHLLSNLIASSMQYFASAAFRSLSLRSGLDLIIVKIMLIVLIMRAKVSSYVDSVCAFSNKDMQLQKLCVNHTKC